MKIFLYKSKLRKLNTSRSFIQEMILMDNSDLYKRKLLPEMPIMWVNKKDKKWINTYICIIYRCTYICVSGTSSCVSAGKDSTFNVGDLGSIPGLGRSPGEGNSYPLQYSRLENSMGCIVHGVAKSQIDWATFTFTGTSPARWLPFPAPGDFPPPREWTHISCIAGRFFITELPGKCPA